VTHPLNPLFFKNGKSHQPIDAAVCTFFD